MTNWRLHGDFSSNNGVPTVILDQNVSIRKLADALYGEGIRVLRALNYSQIPDPEIITESEKYPHSIIVTMDGGFSQYPRALIVPPRGKLRRNCVSLVDDIKYIFGLTDSPPEHYRHSNGSSSPRENAYWNRMDDLRETFHSRR